MISVTLVSTGAAVDFPSCRLALCLRSLGLKGGMIVVETAQIERLAQKQNSALSKNYLAAVKGSAENMAT